MNITQKDIDDLVYNFKWSKENFKDKKVTDIYRQGIYDVVELMKKKEEEQGNPSTDYDVKMTVYADEQAIISRLDKIIELLSWKPSPNIYPYTPPITYDTNKIYCDTASKEGGEE